MTDDLVKRLREVKDWWREPGRTAEQAADRIEELQKQLAASDKQIEYLEEEIENLEYEMCELENRS